MTLPPALQPKSRRCWRRRRPAATIGAGFAQFVADAGNFAAHGENVAQTRGIGDNTDTDDDGDGYLDVDDDFPRDPEEWLDTDGDGTGDVCDPVWR